MEKPIKLLIIDDSQEVLSVLNIFFKRKNYDVVSASDGLDGLKLLETEKRRFDLVITDLVMPNISGIGVISIITKKFPNIPVVAITGWGEHPEALAAEAQADIILEKPFELAELEKKIKALLFPKNEG